MKGQNRPSPPGGGNNNKFLRRWGPILLVIILFLLPWLIPLFSSIGSGNKISYSKFKSQVAADNVADITIQGTTISGTFKNPSKAAPQSNKGKPPRTFRTFIPAQAPTNLLSKLQQNDVQVNTKPPSNGNFWTVLLNILPFAIMIWIFYRLYKGIQQRGQGMFDVGKNRAKRNTSRMVNTKFDEIAGIESAKRELEEVVQFLKSPRKFERFGAKTPKGVLLVGPPGTGKTLLARAVAGEAGVPFFSISGSDFMEMFVGVGASRVRNLFKDAKKKKPSIVFIDELDSIGRSRGAGVGGGHDEREQTLNQLLSEMDGFEPNESVIVMAATNRPDILDKALLRPGRFDRQVTTDLPTKKDRIEVLRIHARGKPFDDGVEFEAVARNTPGFSGADLENLLNEAALLAAQRDNGSIRQEDIDRARDKIVLGLERTNMTLTDAEKRILAYHEGGHAVVGAVLPHTDPVHKVTIIPRQQSMGVTQQMPEKDKYLYDKSYLLSRLAVMMGGRAGEHLKIGTITSGAENDLKQAQKIARRMVVDWGMSDRLSNVALGNDGENVFLGQELGRQRDYSDETATMIDEEVKRILNAAFETALRTLKDHEEGLDSIADALLEDEEIAGSRVYSLLGIEDAQPA